MNRPNREDRGYPEMPIWAEFEGAPIKVTAVLANTVVIEHPDDGLKLVVRSRIEGLPESLANGIPVSDWTWEQSGYAHRGQMAAKASIAAKRRAALRKSLRAQS